MGRPGGWGLVQRSGGLRALSLRMVGWQTRAHNAEQRQTEGKAGPETQHCRERRRGLGYYLAFVHWPSFLNLRNRLPQTQQLTRTQTLQSPEWVRSPGRAESAPLLGVPRAAIRRCSWPQAQPRKHPPPSSFWLLAELISSQVHDWGPSSLLAVSRRPPAGPCHVGFSNTATYFRSNGRLSAGLCK